MSVGGLVTEVIHLPDKVWVNTKERGTRVQCAIYVERTDDAEWIAPGDRLWWQGQWAIWTPQTGERAEVKIPRRGYSGVRRPASLPAGEREGGRQE